MTGGAVHTTLAGWANFYLITGTAAASSVCTLLICVGIHNAWDTITYLTFNALRAEHAPPRGQDRPT